MPVPVLLIAAAAAAAAKGISGAVQAKKAKNEAERLAANRPILPNNGFAQDQLSLAENELSRGGNSAGMNAFNQGIDRDLSNSIGAILKGGGDVNNVAELFDNSQQGRQRALLMSDNLRLNQIDNYVRASQNADNANQQQFQFNQWAPWADNAQANAKSRLAANQKIWGAVDEFGSLAMRGAAGQGEDDSGDTSSPDLRTRGNTVSTYNTPALSTPSVANNFNTINPNQGFNWNINQ